MAAGVFGARPVDRLKMELIEGELIEKMPQNRPHSAALAIAASVLASTFGMGHYMAQQVPLHIDTKSEPEPDVMVVSGSPETTRVVPMAKIPV
jgi:Uma2 family endonuclease